ncbi:MAG: transcription termination factor NusA [Bacteriovoracaceae bacterium]|nr:transcription termination factor NusA [Bacteriovoracaceae bacterium]
MNFSELGRVIEALGKERGIEKDVVIKAIEQAFLVTARKKFGIQGEYEARYNDVDDDIEIYQYKNVVSEVKDPIVDISLESAKNLDENVEIGDQLGIRIDDPQFTRVDIQTARQIIFQKVRDAEREILFAEFKHREGELITGIARCYERGNIIVDLGKADAILPRREIIPGENFKPGDRIQAYLTEVVMTNRGPEVRLSRTSPLFLVQLFEIEVPEIQDGTIVIKSAAREPGQRAKIAVISTDRDIDPVGACVGMKGMRVQNVVNELQGEKIDIVKWADDLDTFTRAALAPAAIENIMQDEENVTIDVVVEDDQLSLAIGRRGQNVRLAAMLTGFKINIISKTKLQERIKNSVENLLQITSLSDPFAQMLVQSGVTGIADLSASTPQELMPILDIDEPLAQKIHEECLQLIEDGSCKLDIEDEQEIITASAIPAYKGILEKEVDEDKETKFYDAERRLREELATFKLK